jgi:hypothetical protein
MSVRCVGRHAYTLSHILYILSTALGETKSQWANVEHPNRTTIGSILLIVLCRLTASIRSRSIGRRLLVLNIGEIEA